MKKWVSIVAVLALLYIVAAVPVNALAAPVVSATKAVSITTEYHLDGSKTVITVYEDTTDIASLVAANSFTKTGSKTIDNYDKSGALITTFTVHGTFSVTPGVSAVCQSASYSYATPGSGWSLGSGSAYPSGNQAIGNAKFVRKILGVTVETDNVTCVLNCDVNGNLS